MKNILQKLYFLNHYITNRKLNRPLNIAIYSGAVPSTTFIERIIHSLAASGYKVYLFGLKTNRIKPVSQVHYFTYKNTKVCKLFQLLKYSLLLTIFKLKDKKDKAKQLEFVSGDVYGC